MISCKNGLGKLGRVDGSELQVNIHFSKDICDGLRELKPSKYRHGASTLPCRAFYGAGDHTAWPFCRKLVLKERGKNSPIYESINTRSQEKLLPAMTQAKACILAFGALTITTFWADALSRGTLLKEL
jgi:hypothetical protein